jgi:hypothetical protein
MKGFPVLGIILLVIGLVLLAKPVISYTTRDKVVDLGPVEVTKETEKNIPISPIAGGAAVVAGVALLMMGKKSTA